MEPRAEALFPALLPQFTHVYSKGVDSRRANPAFVPVLLRRLNTQTTKIHAYEIKFRWDRCGSQLINYACETGLGNFPGLLNRPLLAHAWCWRCRLQGRTLEKAQ